MKQSPADLQARGRSGHPTGERTGPFDALLARDASLPAALHQQANAQVNQHIHLDGLPLRISPSGRRLAGGFKPMQVKCGHTQSSDQPGTGCQGPCANHQHTQSCRPEWYTPLFSVQAQRHQPAHGQSQQGHPREAKPQRGLGRGLRNAPKQGGRRAAHKARSATRALLTDIQQRHARSSALEQQGAVGATKAEVVLQRRLDLHGPRLIGAVIQVALRVLVEDVDGGG
jgi:hypothetical protein